MDDDFRAAVAEVGNLSFKIMSRLEIIANQAEASEESEEYQAFVVNLAHTESEKGGGKIISKSKLLHLFD